MFKAKLLILFFIIFICLATNASEIDTLQHYNYSLQVMPGKLLAIDKYCKRWIKKTPNLSVAVEIGRVALPQDSDAFASDFGYPSLTFGLRYTFNDKIRLHRNPDAAWGMAKEVNYDSHLGNTFSLYGQFYRPFFRHKHFETAYSFSFGLGYSSLKYNKQNDIDNELIGSHILIYFGAGLYATYHLTHQWGIRAGLELVHHSNGALYRPNKGSNVVGPSVGLVYEHSYKLLVNTAHPCFYQPFQCYCYLNFAVGIGAKTMLEDWQLTQFYTPSTSLNYRKENFHIYTAYSLQADVMYRYARRWASGMGVDLFYGTYAEHIAQLDVLQGYHLKHSPWSLGIAAKHEVFYHNLSLNISLGYYLHRYMGHNALANEAKYYERIGFNYTFPCLQGFKVGFNVKAHITKADLSEVVLSYPLKL